MEEKEERNEEKEKETCDWIVSFPMQITCTMDEQEEKALKDVDTWHKSLDGDADKLDIAPNLVFEYMVNSEKKYDFESATKALHRRLAVLGKVATLAKGGAGSDPSYTLAFMCRGADQMVTISNVLLQAGYSILCPLAGTRSRTSGTETVYIVIARKKLVGRRCATKNKPGDQWAKLFPNSHTSALQYNENIGHLNLEEQTATWFLACYAGANDVVWQFNGTKFAFFSEAAIAMQLTVRMLCDDTSKGTQETRKGTELASAYVAQKDSFRMYDKAQVAPSLP